MQNKFTLVIVVVAAVFLGVMLTVQQTNQPIMRRLVAQQEEILSLQKRIDRLVTESAKSTAAASAKAATPTDTEQQLTNLNRKVDTIAAILKPIQQAQQAPQAPSDEYTKVHAIDAADSPVKGNKNAPVTIVEFIDFQCPFCARFHPVVNEVLAAYPSQVKLVLKNYPLSFHPFARPAAKAALAAGAQGKYFEMAELLLNNNRDLNEEKFKEHAKTLGINVNKFMKDFKEKDAEWEKIIEADMRLGESVDVRGTPTFYLNGRKTMAHDLAAYKTEIGEILNKK